MFLRITQSRVVLFMIALGTITAQSGQQPTTAPATNPAVADVLKAEKELQAAMAHNDADAMEAGRLPAFLMTDPACIMRDRDNIVGAVRSNALHFDSITASDTDARVNGDTAVVTCALTMQMTWLGSDISGEYRSTNVFVKRDGKWILMASHLARAGQM